MSKWNDRLAWWIAKKSFDLFASDEYYRLVRMNSALGLVALEKIKYQKEVENG